jgi:hypothetical protein
MSIQRYAQSATLETGTSLRRYARSNGILIGRPGRRFASQADHPISTEEAHDIKLTEPMA